ncbi:MAG: hypothetical protein HY883_03580 [Deltaproteobacteria bacterium]|nr:hypothetical protein [Deltaproteobacteria bacterium]
MKGRINPLPPIADFLFVALFIMFVFFKGHGLLDDGDTGYHIRAGEFIINTLTVPKSDIFSFRTPPLPWTAHEWLSEVIMAVIHRAFGLTGIVIFFSFLISSVYFLLFKIMRRGNGGILAAVVIAVLVISSSSIHWLARPHIFSLLLLVVWYYLLDLHQYDDRNHLYCLPAIMLLWVNLHGGFIIGIVLAGVYLAGNILSSIYFTGAEKEKSGRKARNLALVLLSCLVASLINPYGYHILLFPLKLTSNKFIMDHINEFLSPNFHKLMAFRYLLLLMIAAFAVSKASLNIIEVLLVVLFTSMALYSARHITLFAIVIAPVLVRQADISINRMEGRFAGFLKKKSDGIASIDASSRGYLWPFAAVLMVIIFFAAGRIEYKFDGKKMPVGAVEFLKKEKLSGNMFNNDEFGDYIIYAAWPQYRVFFDGRSDMYGSERLKEYFKVTRIEQGWEEVFKKYEIDWVIYNSGSALSRFLLQRQDWKLIYADGVADIFVKNTAGNGRLMEKYKDAKPVLEK